MNPERFSRPTPYADLRARLVTLWTRGLLPQGHENYISRTKLLEALDNIIQGAPEEDPLAALEALEARVAKLESEALLRRSIGT